VISVDTNVLLHYLLADDPGQFRRAKKLITRHKPALITDVVLAETVWTLTGKRYGFDKTQICGVVRALIGDQGFAFEDAQVVWSALRDYEGAKTIRGKSLDFADALITRKSEYVAQAKGAKFGGLFSFDKAIAQLSGAKPQLSGAKPMSA
jgi:predicted nucleic-acid-binding protein